MKNFAEEYLNNKPYRQIEFNNLFDHPHTTQKIIVQ